MPKNTSLSVLNLEGLHKKRPKNTKKGLEI